MALVQMLLLVGFGILVMKLNWGRDPLALFVILLASALAAAAFGTAMGTFIKTESQANGLSIMFGMVFALMGGCWYPLELFPLAIQNAVKILPTRWAMQGMLDLVFLPALGSLFQHPAGIVGDLRPVGKLTDLDFFRLWGEILLCKFRSVRLHGQAVPGAGPELRLA